jgi:hypothetical protein
MISRTATGALFSLSSDISTRDRDGINKTFSGLMKILFPHGEATEARSRRCCGSPLKAASASRINYCASTPPIRAPKEQHLVFQENQRGVTFDQLFGPYLAGAVASP